MYSQALNSALLKVQVHHSVRLQVPEQVRLTVPEQVSILGPPLEQLLEPVLLLLGPVPADLLEQQGRLHIPSR